MAAASPDDLRRVRDLLLSDDGAKRFEGLDLCARMDAAGVAGEVVEALSRNALTGNERLRALHYLSDHGLARALDDVRTDGWLDQLGAGVAGFEELCDIMGRPFVGLATLLGVQVATLDVFADDLDRSDVGFTLGDGKVERLPMREFKRRIVAAITEDRTEWTPVDPPLNREKVVGLLGPRHVLLAALFDWTLEWIYVSGAPQNAKDVWIDAIRGDAPLTVTLDRLTEMLRDEVEDEWRAYLDPLSGVNPGVVEKARGLLAVDPGRVLDLLGGLFRFVLNYGRRSPPPALDPDLLPVLCEGMVLLGRAHAATGPERIRYAEEVVRMGIQTFPGAPGVGGLHLALGELLVRSTRHGEAIAHLRRAAALAPDAAAEAEPLLVEALYRSGRIVAAATIYGGLLARDSERAERIGRAIVGALERDAGTVIDIARRNASLAS